MFKLQTNPIKLVSNANPIFQWLGQNLILKCVFKEALI